MFKAAISMRRRGNSRISLVFLSYWILLSWFPGFISSAIVTLESVEIFKTHEWLPAKPTVYFQCKGDNKTVLPDVKEAHVLYNFKGEESWQPLTELPDKKCRRCGFYEEDSIKSDDVFDEWEFCASDFTAPDGKYSRIKDKEFNATFLCLQCMPLGSGLQAKYWNFFCNLVQIRNQSLAQTWLGSFILSSQEQIRRKTVVLNQDQPNTQMRSSYDAAVAMTVDLPYQICVIEDVTTIADDQLKKK